MEKGSSIKAAQRFGPFEVDPDAGELRKHGLRVKLVGQPFQILVMLLEHPGRVVTREELRSRLWPADTFVDFESGLNAAVNKLRSALNDSAENPKYIATLPRRGYRFIGTLEPDSGTLQAAEPPAQISSTPPVELSAPTKAVGRTRRKMLAAALALTAVLAVILGFDVGGVRQRLFGDPDGVKIRSIAVLPLANLSGDPEQEYFADGMTDELITDLARLENVRVISRTSTSRYRHVQKSLPEIASELNVDAVVEGSVQSSSGRLHVTAQLVQAHPEKHIWGESYDRPLGDAVVLQEELAQAIAGAIHTSITPQQQAQLEQKRNVSPEAFQLYLKGRYFWNKRTGEGFKRALEYFNDATAADPNYAPAYVGIADSYTMLADYDWLPPSEAATKAKAAVTRALEIDDGLAEAHASLADIRRFYDWDWPGAEREYKRAIELNPNYVTAHQWYAEYLSAMGRHQEAIREMERAQELDPLSVVVKSANGWVLLFAREYDKAIQQCQEVIEMDPSFGEVYSQLRRAYEEKGMYTEALAADEKFRAFKRKGTDRGQPEARRIADAKAYWQTMHDLTEDDLRNNTEAARFRMVEIYAQLGQKDQAFQWLEKNYQEHAFWMPFLGVHPLLDPLRSDPRFSDLMRRMKLAS